jgi:hypothetical protein
VSLNGVKLVCGADQPARIASGQRWQ